MRTQAFTYSMTLAVAAFGLLSTHAAAQQKSTA
jgi:hypothetical protein